MRKGKNPAKLEENNKIEQYCFHQVIIPVYLPELSGYYKEGLNILKLCINSIYLTSHNKTFISVINNGSCFEVENYINQLYDNNKIQEVIHTAAIGKLNAIAKGLSGHNFDFVTITDADVLFTNGWQKAVYNIYETFPKTGMVCTTPQSKRLRQLTETIYFDNLFDTSLKFRTVKSKKDLKEFAKSVENANLFNEVHLNHILSISKNNKIAVIGAGHFTATYRKELLTYLKSSFSENKLGGKTLSHLIDKPTIKYGHWRLSTYQNFTYHLGNIYEDWMTEKFNTILNENNFVLNKPKSNFKKYKLIPFKIFIIRKLIFNKLIWNKFLQIKGLTPYESKIY